MFLKIVLKKSEQYGYGFSLLGVSGLPHVIYDIVENSPAEGELVRTGKRLEDDCDWNFQIRMLFCA